MSNVDETHLDLHIIIISRSFVLHTPYLLSVHTKSQKNNERLSFCSFVTFFLIVLNVDHSDIRLKHVQSNIGHHISVF